MKFLFATALLLLAVFGSTLEQNSLIKKQQKQAAVELRNNLNNFYEHKKVNNKENLKDSYLTPTHSISKSPRSTASAGSSSKTMNIKAKKNRENIWSPNAKPINLFDPNIHKPQKKIQGQNVEANKSASKKIKLVAQTNEEIERLMKKQKEDAFKKSTYDFNEQNYLDQVNDGKETSPEKQNKDLSKLEQHRSDIKKFWATYMSDQKQKEMDIQEEINAKEQKELDDEPYSNYKQNSLTNDKKWDDEQISIQQEKKKTFLRNEFANAKSISGKEYAKLLEKFKMSDSDVNRVNDGKETFAKYKL